MNKTIGHTSPRHDVYPGVGPIGLLTKKLLIDLINSYKCVVN